MSSRAVVVLSLAGCLVSATGCGDRVSRLLAQLDDPDAAVRRAAVSGLVECDARDDRVIAGLTKAVADGDVEVRGPAIVALGEAGPSARSCLPALTTALHDPIPAVQRSAALAILRIDPHERSTVPVLTAAMKEGDGHVVLAVGNMGREADWAVPTLIGLLSHQAPQMRSLAAQTLGRIGPPAIAAKSALQRALADPNVAVQSAARNALERIAAK